MTHSERSGVPARAGDDTRATETCPADARQKEGHYLKVLIAGGISGAISRTGTAPLDRIKVLMQAGVRETKEGRVISDFMTATRSIYQQGSWKGFFNGNGANVLKIVPESAVKFYFFERLNDAIPALLSRLRDAIIQLSRGQGVSTASAGPIHHHHLLPSNPEARAIANIGEGTVAVKLIAGAVAGMIAQFAVYPLEVCKTRLSLGLCNYKGITDCLVTITRTEGIGGMYKGLSPSLVGIIPYAGIDMGVYFSLRQWWSGRNGGPLQSAGGGPNMIVTLIMGATSSFVGQTVSYPFQVVRTRLQMQGVRIAQHETHVPQRYNGIVDCISKIAREEGVAALYRGITANFLKAIPAVSINYVFYEQIRSLLGC